MNSTSFAAPEPVMVQRCGDHACPSSGCGRDKRKIARMAGLGPSPVSASVHEVVGRPGQALDRSTRAFMESRFGHDFSRVRVHTDSRASDSAAGVNALAYTLGHNIVFGAGRFQPSTRSGRYLLAHELTHVVQQDRYGVEPVQRRPPGGTEEMHHELAEQQRQMAGLAPGSGPSDSAIVHGNVLSTVPDLPFFMVERLRPACVPTATARERQAAIAELTDWAMRMTSLGIDWSRIEWVRFDSSAGARGSQTNANDPRRIKISIGPDAFSSVSNLYSTFRHEMVHGVEHQTRSPRQIQARGWGVQEVYAYLWELEHQQETGLARRANWGLSPTGAANTSIGLARAVDGLMRSIQRLSGELQANPSRLSQREQHAIERRVACAMTRTPSQVVRAVFPGAPMQQWQQECAGGVRAVQPKRGDPTELAISSPASSAESEADMVASAVTEGRRAPSIFNAPAASVHRQGAMTEETLESAIRDESSPVILMRDSTEPDFSALAAEDQEYGGCGTWTGSVRRERARAARMASHAAELLQGNDFGRVAALLAAHFHLDPSLPENAADLARVRDQFVRMSNALSSRIRILCRTPVRTPGLPRATMPTDPECRTNVNASSTSCAGGDPTAIVKLCEIALLEMGGPLVKTILHEFAHVACNGNPQITSGGLGGGETYYRDRLPGDTPNRLDAADSYAWFAMDANSILVERTEPASRRGRSRSRAGWWAVAGVGAGLAALGALAPGFLVGGILGLLIGGAGLLGAFD